MILGYFSAEWKVALIVPIPKLGGDSGSCGVYIPILLLSPFRKLYEFFLLFKLGEFTDNRSILRDCKFRFTSGYAMTHALTAFSNNVTSGFHRLNFTKAFDSIM